MHRPIRVVGMVVGEASGDTLGADLIRALRQQYPDLRVIAVAGPQMQSLGVETIASFEALNIVGLFEVLWNIRRLLRLRTEVLTTFLHEPIDLFIGIDAPDFNLRLASRLKEAGIPTVHYVSPSVWAWRQGRVHGIARSIDLMLCVLPFEKDFYDQHHVHAEFVGHPLADQLPLEANDHEARQQLAIPEGKEVLAVLPGSRTSEVRMLAGPLKISMRRYLQEHPQDWILIPAISGQRQKQIEQLFAAELQEYPDRLRILSPHYGPGVGRLAMAVSRQVWLASGTAALEAMLLKKPMLVLYRFHWVTYLLARMLIRISWYSLPNLLLGRLQVPELIQSYVNPDAILETSRQLTNQGDCWSQLFREQHERLRCNASQRAAQAIIALWERNPT